MTYSLSEIAARVGEGADLNDILSEITPPQERAVLERCRLVRQFNRPLVETILSHGVQGFDAGSFDSLIRHPDVESLPRSQGWYRIRQTGLSERAEDLDGDDASAARMHLQLADFFEREGNQRDRLYHLLVASPSEAAALFEALYHEADARFDLAACADLLAILESRRRHLTPELAALRRKRQRYLEARSFWEDEFYQTVRYFHRTHEQERLETLLMTEGPWILQLHGTGGLGKTMFIRWLAARRCVPDHIPCARIDFDFIDPVQAALAPWTFMVRFAEQLDPQLPGAPLRELLEETREYLQRWDSSAYRSSAAPDAYADKMAHSVPFRLARGLQDALPEGPVVLIFDTLEEALLRHGTDLMGIIDTMSELHADFPGLRLILSGRYDLTERLPSFNERYGGATENLEFHRFADEESARFLLETHEVPEDAPVDVAVDLGDGLPFKLSLLAELLHDGEQLDRDYADVGILYLIRRIVKRIPDKQLRWLLRYGVVPRRLSFEFVRDVMAPYLEEGMSGATDLDDAAAHLPETEREAFPTGLLSEEAAAMDYSELWQKLKQYASRSSWVFASGQGDMLAFHGDVVEPMRRVLRDQPVYCALHAAAADHYEKKAQAEAKEWVRWAREALYHRFQAEGEAARPHWDRWVRFAEGSSASLYDLALEITGPEYVDEAGEPREHVDGRSMVPGDVVADAFLLIARNCLEQAEQLQGPESTSAWREAEAAVARFEHLGARGMESSFDPGWITLIRTRFLQHDGRYEEALALTQASLTDERTLVQARLRAEEADLLARLTRFADAARAYDAAADLLQTAAAGVDTATADAVSTFSKQMLLYRRLGRVDRAIECARSALDHASGDARDALLEHLATLYLERGTPADVVALFEESSERDLPKYAVLPLGFLAATALSRRGDPLRAHEICRTALRRLSEDSTSALTERRMRRSSQLFAAGLRARAEIDLSLLRYDMALSDLEHARFLRRELGEPIEALQDLLSAARIFLLEVGDLNRAEDLLSQAESFSVSDTTETARRVRMLRALWLDRTGAHSEAGSILMQLLDDPFAADYPFLRGEIALFGIMLRQDEAAASFTNTFLSALEAIESDPARLARLDDIRYVRSTAAFDERQRDRLVELVDRSLAGLPLEQEDLPRLPLLALEALAVSGARDAALRLLERIAVDQTDPISFVRLCECAERIGPEARQLANLEARLQTFFPEVDALSDALFLTDTKSIYRSDRKDPVLLDHLLGRALLATANVAEYVEGPEQASRWTQRAGWLRRDLSQATAWSAEALLCEGRLAHLLGNQELARNSFLTAKETYRRLGDRLMTQAVKEHVSRLEAPPALSGSPPDAHSPTDTGSPGLGLDASSAGRPFVVINITWQSEHDGLGVTFHDSSGQVIGSRIITDGVLASGMRRKSHAELFAQDHFEAFVKGSDIVLEMETALTDGRLLDLIDRSTSDEAPQLCIQTEVSRPALGALPWEAIVSRSEHLQNRIRTPFRFGHLQHLHHERIRRLQIDLSMILGDRIVADGRVGPQTVRAVRRLQEEEGLAPDGEWSTGTQEALRRRLAAASAEPDRMPTVLVLRPSVEEEFRADRGTRIMGTDIAATYGREGIRPIVVEQDHVSALEHYVGGDDPPDAIHCMAMFKESSSLGAIHLDFSHDHRVMRKSQRLNERTVVTASLLDRFLSESEAAAAPPLLILDVPPPPGSTETIRQMLLRNMFAAEVNALAPAATILATGLVHWNRRPFLDGILSRLLRAERLADVLEQLHDAVPPDSTVFTSILLTADPDQPARPARFPRA